MTQGPCAGQPLLGTTIVPATQTPLYEGVLAWVTGSLTPVGLPRPLSKRLAVAISGLVMSNRATVGEVSSAVSALGVSQAKGESIARRLQRTLRDARLDPSLLPLIFGGLLPELLADQVGAHTANIGTPEWHHERFVGVVIVLDESSQEDEVHLLVAGVPFGGVVLPLAVRTWEQNVAMPVEEYWTQLTGLLLDVQQMLPAELREHVLLTADRAYGVPRMLDVLCALGWNWLLRAQGQTQVRLPDGTCRPLRQLVPMPGKRWSGGFGSAQGTETAQSSPVDVFKAAGWRRSQVVAVWPEGQREPWLLVTSLPAKLERVEEYAQRWAIERLFLAWKSHGWDIEASGIHDAQRLGRWLTVIALATLWRLAMALPMALEHLADLAARAGRGVRQLRLPSISAPPRPWPAKFSLLTLGAKVAHMASRLTSTPALCWRLPFWEGRTWDQTCRHVYLTAHRQFSISP